MARPEFTMEDVDRAVLEEMGIEPTGPRVVWDRMGVYVVEQGITAEFLDTMADRLMAGVEVMQMQMHTPPIQSFTSAFKNAFLLGWIAHKVLGNGETEG